MSSISIFILSTFVAILAPVSSADTDGLISDFYVPPHIRLNEDAVLQCPYDIKDQKLESVAWFFNSTEFYRYSMEGSGINKQVFNNKSFIVDKDMSNDTSIILRSVQLSATGKYMCKIHTDGPHFDTDSRESKLQVIVIPDESPTLQKLPKKRLRPGTRISIKCTSPPSIPAATLSFQINKRKLPKKLVKTDVVKVQNGLYVTNAHLNMILKRSYFEKGKANITCSSQLKTFESWSDKLVVNGSVSALPEVCAVLALVMYLILLR